jgi:putative transposase
MAKTEHYYTQFESGNFYHIYNRTIDKGKLFANEDNYSFFLKKFDEYLSDYVETYAYCLLGNHFHWLIRILPEEVIREKLIKFEKENPAKILGKKKLTSEKTIHEIVSHQFQKFFQSYAMAYNKQHDRVGTLFQTPFKRALVDNDKYFTNLIYYIHTNPQKHGICNDFREYQWSSYQRFLIDRLTKLRKQEVLDWFGGKDEYSRFHATDEGRDLPKGWDLDD